MTDQRFTPAFEVPGDVDGPLRTFLEAVKEYLEVADGFRGDLKGRFVTLSELEQAGLVKAIERSGRAEIASPATTGTVTSTIRVLSGTRGTEPSAPPSDTPTVPGEITFDTFAAGIEPVGIVDELPPVADYVGPKLVYLTTNGKLYRYVEGQWTTAVAAVDVEGIIQGSQLAPNSVGLAQLAPEVSPVEVVSALPTTGLTDGRIVLLSADQRLYWFSTFADAWIPAATYIPDDSVSADMLMADSVVAGKVAANAIGTNQLSAGAVTASKIGAGEVTAGKLAAGAVTAGTIGVNAITAGTIAANAVTVGTIAAGAVRATELAANAVEASKIKANAVTADKIAANSVTADKLAADIVLGGLIKTQGTTRVELQGDAVFPLWIGSGTKGVESGSPGSGAKLWFDTQAGQLYVSGVLVQPALAGGVSTAFLPKTAAGLDYDIAITRLHTSSTPATLTGVWAPVGPTVEWLMPAFGVNADAYKRLQLATERVFMQAFIVCERGTSGGGTRTVEFRVTMEIDGSGTWQVAANPYQVTTVPGEASVTVVEAASVVAVGSGGVATQRVRYRLEGRIPSGTLSGVRVTSVAINSHCSNLGSRLPGINF